MHPYVLYTSERERERERERGKIVIASNNADNNVKLIIIIAVMLTILVSIISCMATWSFNGCTMETSPSVPTPFEVSIVGLFW